RARKLPRAGGVDVVRSRPDGGLAHACTPPHAWHRRRAPLPAPRVGPSLRPLQTRARLFLPRAGDAPAVHRLFGEGPAVSAAAGGASGPQAAAADLDGAHAGRPRARGTLCRSDHFRGVSPVAPQLCSRIASAVKLPNVTAAAAIAGKSQVRSA